MIALNDAIATALGTTYGAYHLQAPTEAAYPFIVWNWQGGGKTADHDVNDGLEFVRAFGTSTAQAGTVYAYFDGILDGGTLSVSGFETIRVRREDEVELIETLPNGQLIFQLGALYRVTLDK